MYSLRLPTGAFPKDIFYIQSSHKHLMAKAQFFPLGDDNPVTRIAFVNWALMLANIAIFVWSLGNFEDTIYSLGFIPAEFSVMTMFTSMFLHGDLIHLLGNMWYLFIFGDNVEEKFGHLGYLVFYIMAGLAATVSHYLLNIGSVIPAIGASGAISGVLGAYLVFYPNAGVYVSGAFGRIGWISAKFMLLLWFGIQLLSSIGTFMGAESSIAFFAHIGGFMFGAAASLVWKGIAR
jgi:membrane associated rhomboid family serine protease